LECPRGRDLFGNLDIDGGMSIKIYGRETDFEDVERIHLAMIE
jgi:hypothetical protein